jgi:hypothetical protein
VVRESQRSRKVLGSFNSTFITLIHKKQYGVNVGDYWPISCSNVIYKIVAIIISRRINPIQSEIIFEEQFGFFHRRKIHDAVALTQEAC